MWIVFIARKALLSFYYFIVMRLFSGSLNSKMICGLSSESVLIDSNSRGELDVKFKTPLLSVPTYVVATPYVSMGNVGADIAVSKITALGFHASIRNQSATGAYFKVSYIAGSK